MWKHARWQPSYWRLWRHSQNPGFFELVRDRLGQWRQATEEAASNSGTQPTVCTERPGWTAVRDLWEGAGSAAADLYMEWPDRNQVWRQVEVTLIECTTGETHEGRAGGEGVWNTQHAALTSAIQQWSASMTRHAEAAYDAADDPIRAPRPQNPQELLALVEAARASTALAMASERRCSEERATLAALHTKLNDTTHCQLCPAGHGSFQQTRWHVLRKLSTSAQWKPRGPSATSGAAGGTDPVPSAAGSGAVETARLSILESSVAALTSLMTDFIQAQKSPGATASPVSLQKSKDQEISIGSDSSSESEQPVRGKRRRASEWFSELENLVADGSEEEGDATILGSNQRVGADPTATVVSGLNAKKGILKPGEVTPKKGRAMQGILSSLLQNSVSPQQQQQIDQNAQAERFPEAEAKVGLSIDVRSLKAIDGGMLAKVQLGHFAPSSGSLAASNANAERSCVWFSFADR